MISNIIDRVLTPRFIHPAHTCLQNFCWLDISTCTSWQTSQIHTFRTELLTFSTKTCLTHSILLKITVTPSCQLLRLNTWLIPESSLSYTASVREDFHLYIQLYPDPSTSSATVLHTTIIIVSHLLSHSLVLTDDSNFTHDLVQPVLQKQPVTLLQCTSALSLSW